MGLEAYFPPPRAWFSGRAKARLSFAGGHDISLTTDHFSRIFRFYKESSGWTTAFVTLNYYVYFFACVRTYSNERQLHKEIFHA